MLSHFFRFSTLYYNQTILSVILRIYSSYLPFFKGDGTDYLNVAMKDGCLILTMGLSNGKQEMQIKPNKVRFDDNQWHKVSVHRRIQEVSD